MKNHPTAPPVLTVIVCAAAFFLRRAQMRLGFSPETGLSIPGDPYARLLTALVLAWSVLLLALSGLLPARHPDPRPMEAVFPARRSAPLLFAGTSLLILSGALWCASVRSGALALSGGTVSRWGALIAGGAVSCGGVCLLAALCSLRAGRRVRVRRAVPVLLLPAPAAAVCLLVVLYRLRSVSPSIGSYAVELLAVCLSAAALCRLAGFAFGDGSPRAFVFLAGEACVFCAAALADGRSAGETALYGGFLLLFWGLLCALRLEPGRRQAPLFQENFAGRP